MIVPVTAPVVLLGFLACYGSYFNREDPALVVPMRSGIGFSHNYARPSIWAMTFLILAVVLAAGWQFVQV